MMGYGWGMGLAGWMSMAVFWIMVIGLVVWAVVTLLPATRSGGREESDSPEEILERRFALGEIDAEQYRRMREELGSTRTGRR